MIITPYIIIISIAILTGFYFSVKLFFNSSQNKISNIYLALFTLTVTTLLLANFFVITDLFKTYPHAIGISFSLWYIIPQLFYFYIRQTINHNYKLMWYDVVHIIPFAYSLYNLIPFYILPANTKLNWFNNFLLMEGSVSFSSIFIILVSFCYLGYSTYLLFNFENKYKCENSDTMIELISGIKRLVAVYIIYKLFDITGFIAVVLGDQSKIEITQFISFSLTLFIFVIAYTILKQPEKLFSTALSNKRKYTTSALSKTDIDKYADELLKIMAIEKPYLNSNIKLNSLAQLMRTTTHNVSQVINQKFEMNFYDFINNYRIEDVKTKLIDPANSHLTILAIAYETGFNSKSAFNKIFKKIVKQSPSEFMKANIQSKAA